LTHTRSAGGTLTCACRLYGAILAIRIQIIGLLWVRFLKSELLLIDDLSLRKEFEYLSYDEGE